MKSQTDLNPQENVLQIDLITNMHVSVKKGNMKIIFAALLPKNASILLRQSALRRRRITDALKMIVSEDARLHLFAKNSSTAVCDKIRLEGDKLTCTNLKIIDFHQSLFPIYYSSSRIRTLENFVLFSFYEIKNEETENLTQHNVVKIPEYY